MVDKDFLGAEERSETGDQLRTRNVPGYFDNHHAGIKRYRELFGEISIASPTISLTWDFEPILRA